MSYQQVNEKAVAKALKAIYRGPEDMDMKVPTAPISCMWAGKGVLLGSVSAHNAADVKTLNDSSAKTGTFTIEFRKTSGLLSKKFFVSTTSQGSAELKDEIERCIRAAIPEKKDWEVRIEP